MYKKSIISKPDHRRIRDTKRSDRGDHTTGRVCQSPHVVVESEFQAEILDGYSVGKCLGSYMRRVQGTVGGTGDTGKLMAKRQEEAAMKKMTLARLMFQANTQYGVRLSERHLRKIEAKMLKETQPLDINKRRMLYQMYTFRKPGEDKINVIKEEALTQPDSPEMESEIEEPVENTFVRTNEGVQTDISCSNNTKAETATLPTQIPVVMAKGNLQGNPAGISNTPSQRKHSEIANLPSQRTSVQMAKETLQRKTGISTPLAKNLPADVGKYPSDVGSQPSQKISVDTVKEPLLKKAEAVVVYHRSPVDMAKETWQRKQTETLNPTLTPTVDTKKEYLQRKQTETLNPTLTPTVDTKKEYLQRKQTETLNPTLTPTVDTKKESLQRKQTETLNPTLTPTVDTKKEYLQRKQTETLNPTLTPTVDTKKESLQRKQTQIGNQSVIQAFIANTTSRTQAKSSSQKILSGSNVLNTNQWTKSPIRQLNTVNGPFQKQVNLPHSPRKRNARIPHDSNKKHNDRECSAILTKNTEMAHSPVHTRQKKLVDKPHSPIERKKIDAPQHSPLMRKRIVRSPKKSNVQQPPLHTKYTPISTQKSLPTNHKRKPVIKTLTITQKGHSTKIYKAVSFVEQKKASLKINMDHKSVSRAASSSRSHKSKHLSTSQDSSSNLLCNSPKRVEKDDSPTGKESPSSIAKLVMNRRNKNKRRKRARSPDMEEAPPPLTEVAKWAPQSVNEHTKPYYEAWVNTTLTAVSSDNEHVRKEKERIMELMRERLETCLLSEEELSDEKYTGRIKVVTHR